MEVNVSNTSLFSTITPMWVFLEKVTKEPNGIIVSKTLDIFLSAYETMGSAFIQTLPLELAVIKIIGEK